MEKTGGRTRRRQLFAAVSVLGVSLGMADVAHAAKQDATTQTSHKGQAAVQGQSSIKYGAGQSSWKEPIRTGAGQSSIKYGAGQSSWKEPIKNGAGQSSYKYNAGGQSSIKGETQ